MTAEERDEDFERLLEYLKRERGFDFSGYKRSSLTRRVAKRMQSVHVENFADYQDFLEVHPEEFAALFDTILINVTQFFRDADAWAALRGEHIPRMIARKAPDSPIRVWSAGCASGEEPYSLVIALAEELGIEQFKERVKVYATDMDDHALLEARVASYTEKDLAEVDPGLRERYFESTGGRFVFRQDLRRYVVFGAHDLLTDAPISHLDLLSCRNALMYFNSEAQARILARFHFALRDSGMLFLGRAEMLRSHGSLFAPLDLKARIFTKVENANGRDRLLMLSQADRADTTPALLRRLRVREAAIDAYSCAQLVVDPAGTVILINRAARDLFSLSETDIGKPIQDLRVSYLPVEIRSRLDEVRASRRGTSVRGVTARLPNGETYTLNIQFSPLLDRGPELLGISVSFDDVTRQQRLQEDLAEANQELETAYEELQSTNEELETTNEELQLTIEELETTNEELQSTNEEMETMNEELQSTNEELETINDELRQRSLELDDANTYMHSILASLGVGVAVMDRDLLVKLWSREAEELWGLRETEVVGEPFLSQEIGLPVGRLHEPFRACLDRRSSQEEIVLDAVNRRGKSIRCRATCTPLSGQNGDVRGVVLVMEDWQDPEVAAGG
ncbi:MAG: PAS domain-containing protein [Gemmatimonadetes bacterium]|nr:PAS domain-containing protein [Gemmatimonadota bacterium]